MKFKNVLRCLLHKLKMKLSNDYRMNQKWYAHLFSKLERCRDKVYCGFHITKVNYGYNGTGFIVYKFEKSRSLVTNQFYIMFFELFVDYDCKMFTLKYKGDVEDIRWFEQFILDRCIAEQERQLNDELDELFVKS